LSEIALDLGGVYEIDGFIGFGHFVEVVAVLYASGAVD
jgi:hypothetical protein